MMVDDRELESGGRGFDVLLIGLRGSGKSTVGAGLASRFGMAFVDLDVEVLRAMGGRTVAEVWSRDGERAFRRAEGETLGGLLGDGSGAGGRVIALGGGTPTVERAGRAIEEARRAGRAMVVYLRAEPGRLAGRIGAGDENRPRLGDATSVDEEMARMFAARDGMYRSLADVVVDASGSLDEVVALVCGWVEGVRWKH